MNEYQIWSQLFGYLKTIWKLQMEQILNINSTIQSKLFEWFK